MLFSVNKDEVNRSVERHDRERRGAKENSNRRNKELKTFQNDEVNVNFRTYNTST
jgi:hypothetical protein